MGEKMGSFFRSSTAILCSVTLLMISGCAMVRAGDNSIQAYTELLNRLFAQTNDSSILQEASASETESIPLHIVMVNKKDAKVFNGPAFRYTILWRPRLYTPLETIARYRDWYAVRDVEGDVGWTHQSQIAEHPAAIVKPKYAKIRNAPSSRSQILFKAPKNYTFKIIGKKGEWYKIEDYEGDKGWVDAKSVWGGDSSSEMPLPHRELNPVSVSSHAEIFNGPAFGKRVLWKPRLYTPLEVLANYKDWYAVRDVEGDVGWIHNSVALERPAAIVTSEYLNVRQSPNTKSGILIEAPKNYTFKIIGKKGEWYKIEDHEGDKGWVDAKSVWVGTKFGLIDGNISQATAISTPQPKREDVHTASITANMDFGEYHALVIGINKYPYLKNLNTATSDAGSISNILTNEYGFNVKLLIDPTRSEIISAMSELRRKLTPNDNLLIYYAGHGWLDSEADEGYWLPADATRKDESNWLSNATITSSIRAMKAKHVMVVADSCFSGKLTRGLHIKRKSPDYLARISRKTARVVLTSGGLEPVIDSGGSGRHSVFASALIRILKENNGALDGTSMFSKIRRMVMLNADQTPEYSDIRKVGHDGGDFIFVKR